MPVLVTPVVVEFEARSPVRGFSSLGTAMAAGNSGTLGALGTSNFELDRFVVKSGKSAEMTGELTALCASLATNWDVSDVMVRAVIIATASFKVNLFSVTLTSSLPETGTLIQLLLPSGDRKRTLSKNTVWWEPVCSRQ